MTGSSLAKIGLWKQKQDSKNCFCWRSPIKKISCSSYMLNILQVTQEWKQQGNLME